MRYFLFSICAITLIYSSGCARVENDGPSNYCPPIEQSAPFQQIATLESYIANQNIEAIRDDRGFYYFIEEEGNDLKPNPCSNIIVDYEGKLTNGFVFDSGEDFEINLSQLISGWQAGLPYIGEGGKIILFLPPFFGYGSQPMGNIPANSITIFTITLQKVNN